MNDFCTTMQFEGLAGFVLTNLTRVNLICSKRVDFIEQLTNNTDLILNSQDQYVYGYESSLEWNSKTGEKGKYSLVCFPFEDIKPPHEEYEKIWREILKEKDTQFFILTQSRDVLLSGFWTFMDAYQDYKDFNFRSISWEPNKGYVDRQYTSKELRFNIEHDIGVL